MPRANIFTIELSAAADPLTTWNAVLDLDAHQRLIPLTTLRWEAPLREGARFVARTGLGPLAIDDAMEVTAYTPPTAYTRGSCHIRKTGRWMGGEIEFSVAPAERGCRLVWRQAITVRGLPPVLDPVVRRVARAAYRKTLLRLIDQAGN